MTSNLKNITGAPATGDSFFDREEVQAQLWDRLDTDNVLLLAPRRVGKTSLLRRLEDTAESHGFRAVYLSVSDKSSERAFIETLYGAIGAHPDGKVVVDRLSRGRSRLSSPG